MKKLFTILLLALTFTMSAQNLTLSNHENLTIDGDVTYENVTLGNHSTLTVNGTLTVTNLLKLKNHSELITTTTGMVITNNIELKNHSTINSYGCTSYQNITQQNHANIYGNVYQGNCGETLTVTEHELPKLNRIDGKLNYFLYDFSGRLISSGKYENIDIPLSINLILKVDGYKAKKIRLK